VTIDQREITKIKKDPSDLAEIEKQLMKNLENTHQGFKTQTFSIVVHKNLDKEVPQCFWSFDWLEKLKTKLYSIFETVVQFFVDIFEEIE
jgi:hypothetical protein